MSQHTADIPLNDIQPPVDVPDASWILFMLAVLVGIVFVIRAAVFVRSKFRNRSLSERRRFYTELATIDFSDPKRGAYAVCEIGRHFAHDNERTEKAYQDLFERLEPYKYAPEVKTIDPETLEKYRSYLKSIDL